MSPPTFVLSEMMSGEDFIQSIDAAYAEVVRWKHNLFLTPSGKSGREFVSELARLFRSYGEGSALESIAIKAAMVLPHLLLQKPFSSAKTQDHIEFLQRRLILWKIGDINNLLDEGRTIQHHLQKNYREVLTDNKDRASRHFAKLMAQGKVGDALKIISKGHHFLLIR